jgi:type II secretory pathway component GspD/PulD (secretin)
VFQKLTGWRFEAIVHALEDDADTNTLSAPRILTLDNQEASIMVGYHTPIFKTDVSSSATTGGTSASTITQTLDYYQEIGIKLFVVPQVNEEGYINMIIHPSVTSSSRNQNAQIIATDTDPVTTPYPVIDVRETQTQVLLKDGETIVIGGLLKDENGKETQGIPFLESVPILGGLFRRDTYTKRKIDLLIFITARVIQEGEYTEEQLAKLKEELGKEQREIAAAEKKKKKKASAKKEPDAAVKK